MNRSLANDDFGPPMSVRNDRIFHLLSYPGFAAYLSPEVAKTMSPWLDPLPFETAQKWWSTHCPPPSSWNEAAKTLENHRSTSLKRADHYPVAENRYTNIVCKLDTQVKPRTGGGGFLHANRIVLRTQVNEHEVFESTAFAGQAPLPHQYDAFFSFLGDERDCDVVVTIGQAREGIIEKMDPYWLDSKAAVKSDKPNKLFGDYVVMRSLQVGGDRVIPHIHFTAWPDHSTPHKTVFDQLIAATVGYSRPFVHCSAGVGRTSVFIACWHFARMFVMGKLPRRRQNGKEIANQVVESVIQMREGRHHMVTSMTHFETILSFLCDCLARSAHVADK